MRRFCSDRLPDGLRNIPTFKQFQATLLSDLVAKNLMLDMYSGDDKLCVGYNDGGGFVNFDNFKFYFLLTGIISAYFFCHEVWRILQTTNANSLCLIRKCGII